MARADPVHSVSGLTSTNFTDNFRAFESTITRFITTLLPLHQLAATMPDDKYTLYMIHSLAQTAMIRLHQPFITEDQVSREKSLRAARSVVMVTKHITESDFDFLDPLLGVSFALSLPPCYCRSPFVSTIALLGICGASIGFRARPDAECLAAPRHQQCSGRTCDTALRFDAARHEVPLTRSARPPTSSPDERSLTDALLDAGYEAAKMRKILDTA